VPGALLLHVCTQDLIRDKEFRTLVQLKQFEQFDEALTVARQGFKDGKVLLTF